MTAAILSLLGSGLGALMRLVPELLKLWTNKQDHAHELDMTKLQLEIDKARATQEIDKVHANEGLEAVRGEFAAYFEAIKGQGQLTGVKFIDGINQSVRPVLTYWWMLLFTVYKLNVIYNSSNIQEFLKNLWTDNDAGILSMILAFWFVDRAFKYIAKR